VNVGPAATVLAVPGTVTPSVISLNPASRPVGATNATVTVTGTGFAAGATVGFSGTGVTVNSVTVTSGTQLNVSVSVAAGAALGARDVTVTNPGALSATLLGGFTVTAAPLAPVVSALSPNVFGLTSTNVATTITGANFVSGATVTVSGTGVTVAGVAFASATSLRANVSVTSAAALGARNVTVRNPDGTTGTCTGCLTVGGAITITSLTPTSRAQGATNQSITINGSGFGTGDTASFGAGITVSSLTINSASRVTAVVTVAPTATLGGRTVTVTAPDGRVATRANGFSVTAAPKITSVTPTSIRRGRLAVFTVNGSGFQNGARLTFSGTGITLNFSGVSGTTSVVAVITVASNAPLGPRTVTITNPDGTTTSRLNAVQVTT
jgi:hypothetical protein